MCDVCISYQYTHRKHIIPHHIETCHYSKSIWYVEIMHTEAAIDWLERSVVENYVTFGANHLFGAEDKLKLI